MGSEARLLAFESWMNAALRGGDWLAPLRDSASLLGARTVAIWTDADTREVLSASPEAPAEFVRCCAQLANAHGAGVFERDECELGRIVWAKLNLDGAEGSGELLFAGLFHGPVDIDLFREIAGIAARSAATRARLASVRAASALKTAAFDQLPFGVVIVDRHLHFAEANDACRQILTRADGLNVVRDKLLCRDSSDQAALLRAVDRALVGDASVSTLRVRRKRSAQPYVVRVVAPRAAGGPTHCLLMIVDPDEEPSPGGEIWRAMFDLTECELIIAEGLVLGYRIYDIANQRGVSIETVRTQTKRMFERLNVSSQAEAVVRLSRTAPFRRARAERCRLTEDAA